MCLYPSSQFIYLVFSCSFIFPFIYSFIVHLTAAVLYAVYWAPQIKRQRGPGTDLWILPCYRRDSQ